MDESKLPCGWAHKLPQFCNGRDCESCSLNLRKQLKEELEGKKRLPCGWTEKLPRFCKGRKCEECSLNIKNQKDRQKNEVRMEEGF